MAFLPSAPQDNTMAHGKIDDSKDGPVYLGFIPEKAARITVVMLLLLAIATYAFGVEVFF